MQILDTKWFDNPSLLLGDLEVFSLEMDRPLCSTLASKALQSIEKKDLRYPSSDGKIWAEWGSPKDKHLIDGLEQVQTYVKALAELPNLVLRYFRRTGINIKIGDIGKVKEEIICQRFLGDYVVKSQWLEYLLLHNQSRIKELKSTNKKHLKQNCILSQLNYSLIQKMWAKADPDENNHFQWLLHFDSPAQIWFRVEADNCQAHMTRGMTPGDQDAAKSKEAYYYDVVKHCEKRLQLLGRDIDFDFSTDEEGRFISLTDALEITALRMSTSKDFSISDAYESYLKAWRSEARHQRGCKGLQRSHIDSNGRLKTGRENY
jgi:hypothetical protein